MSGEGDTRCEQYRDLLEVWTAWWNNVGRSHFTHYILPPLTATGDALRCTLCAGESADGRCAACGRKMSGAA